MKRKPQKSGMSTLVKKADTAFSRYVRLKHSDESGTCSCVTCGKLMHWKEAHAGHFVSRRHMSLRWDERNVFPQCCGCNTFNAGALDEYSAYIIRTYGHSTFDDLLKMKRQTKKWTRAEIEDLIVKYKAGIVAYEGRRYEL
jgi:hypothetical protein